MMNHLYLCLLRIILIETAINQRTLTYIIPE